MLSRLSGKRYHGVGWPLWISEKALPKDNSRYFLFIFLVIYITIITIFYFSYSMRWFFLNDLSYMDYGYGYGWILIFFTFTEWKWKLEFKFLNQSGNFLELLVKFHLGFLVFLFILFFLALLLWSFRPSGSDFPSSVHLWHQSPGGCLVAVCCCSCLCDLNLFHSFCASLSLSLLDYWQLHVSSVPCFDPFLQTHPKTSSALPFDALQYYSSQIHHLLLLPFHAS